MSRTGINYVDVARAAAEVQGRNENPTVDKIREILGTGSKSTIARHLKEWRLNNCELASKKGLPDELVSVVTGLWERLQRESDQEVLDYQEIIDEKLQELDTNLAQTQKNNAELQQQNHTLEEQLFKANEYIKSNDQLLEDELIKTSKQQSQINNLEEQLAMQKHENEKIHSLLKNIQNNLEHYQDVVQKLQQEQALALDKQKNQFTHEITMLRQQLTEAGEVEHALKMDKQQLTQKLTQLDLVEKQNHALQLTNKQQEIQINNLQEAHNIVIAANEKTLKDLELKNQSIIESNQHMAIAESRVQNLEKTVEKLEDKIANLRQEQLFIIQQKSILEGQLKQLITHQ